MPDAYVGTLQVCFVVLRAGACVSESELHEHAQRTIGERPAWPKQFHIVDAIPVTSVGKIFKPELCCYAAARLVRGVLLEQHRLPDAQVRVSAGGTRGLIVSVTLPSTAQAALRPSHRRWPVICSRPASRSPDLRHNSGSRIIPSSAPVFVGMRCRSSLYVRAGA